MAARSAARRFAHLPTVWTCGVEAAVASTAGARLLGLAYLERERAVPLLLPRCSCVHTFGMRFELDLLFLDELGATIGSRRRLPPRRVAFCGGASAVLELPVG